MTNAPSCPCGRSAPFEKCCGRFLSGDAYAKTPEQLMRSRYCAYALGGYGEYLMTTWLPATAQGLTAAELSEKTLNWQKLKVITSSQKGDNGVVEFEACYNDTENPHDMKIMHEISEFIRIKSRWYYIGGRVS